MLENSIKSEFSSFWPHVSVHQLIIIDSSDYFIIKKVGTYHTIGAHSPPWLLLFRSVIHVVKFLLDFMCSKHECSEVLQILRRKR